MHMRSKGKPRSPLATLPHPWDILITMTPTGQLIQSPELGVFIPRSEVDQRKSGKIIPGRILWTRSNVYGKHRCPSRRCSGFNSPPPRQKGSRRNLLCATTYAPGPPSCMAAPLWLSPILWARPPQSSIWPRAQARRPSNRKQISLPPCQSAARYSARQRRFIAGDAPWSGKPRSRTRRGA